MSEVSVYPRLSTRDRSGKFPVADRQLVAFGLTSLVASPSKCFGGSTIWLLSPESSASTQGGWMDIKNLRTCAILGLAGTAGLITQNASAQNAQAPAAAADEQS